MQPERNTNWQHLLASGHIKESGPEGGAPSGSQKPRGGRKNGNGVEGAPCQKIGIGKATTGRNMGTNRNGEQG